MYNVIYLGMFRFTNIGIATIFATIVAPDESLHIRITADRVYSAKHAEQCTLSSDCRFYIE